MNGTQLIWVVLLTFTFIVAILTAPILLIPSSQNTRGSVQVVSILPVATRLTAVCLRGVRQLVFVYEPPEP